MTVANYSTVDRFLSITFPGTGKVSSVSPTQTSVVFRYLVINRVLLEWKDLSVSYTNTSFGGTFPGHPFGQSKTSREINGNGRVPW